MEKVRIEQIFLRLKIDRDGLRRYCEQKEGAQEGELAHPRVSRRPEEERSRQKAIANATRRLKILQLLIDAMDRRFYSKPRTIHEMSDAEVRQLLRDPEVRQLLRDAEDAIGLSEPVVSGNEQRQNVLVRLAPVIVIAICAVVVGFIYFLSP
jgi:hypothetical protein